MNERLKRALKLAVIGCASGLFIGCGVALSVSLTAGISLNGAIGIIFGTAGGLTIAAPLGNEISKCCCPNNSRVAPDAAEVDPTVDLNQHRVEYVQATEADILHFVQTGAQDMQPDENGTIPYRVYRGMPPEDGNVSINDSLTQRNFAQPLNVPGNNVNESVQIPAHNLTFRQIQNDNIRQSQQQQIIPQINAQVQEQIQQREQGENNNELINQNSIGIHIQGEMQRRNSGSNLQQG